MQMICISRGSYEYGQSLAERLAAKLGYDCLSRELLTDAATAHGIPVGKIEMSILKRRPLSDALSIEVDRFKAFVATFLCERALEGGIVYHGRSGHLVLPGLSHVLRVRTIADMEERITLTTKRMSVSRVKARSFNHQVDDDIRRWVRVLYNVDWEDPALYDLTINASHLSVENSASVLVEMAQLPEFQVTPASRQTLEDLLLAAQCRLAIGKDKRTHDVSATVRAKRGHVSVTYLPRQAGQAAAIPTVLGHIVGIESLVRTIATTTILYIQEEFTPEAEHFQHLVEVAEKWNAAVELVRLVGGADAEQIGDRQVQAAGAAEAAGSYNGGVLEDQPDAAMVDDLDGVPDTIDSLIQVGRAGGFYTVHGGPEALARSLSRTVKYSLIVVGDVFLSKGEAVRKRLKRDLVSFLAEKFRSPVIGTDELKSQLLFGPRQCLSTLVLAAVVALIYLVVFGYQGPILEFLTRPGTFNRALAALAVGAFVPFAASVIGGLAHNILKLIKLE